MNDKDFQIVLDKLSKAHHAYKKLLYIAEEEYKRRFGYYPSDIDDDSWIDIFHIIGGKATVKEVTEWDKNSIETKRS